MYVINLVERVLIWTMGFIMTINLTSWSKQF